MTNLQFKFNLAAERGKLFECVSEPLRDNDCVERQRFTHLWSGIRLFFLQQPESGNGTSIGEQPGPLFWEETSGV